MTISSFKYNVTKTNSSHLKHQGWKMNNSFLGKLHLAGALHVGFRGCNFHGFSSGKGSDLTFPWPGGGFIYRTSARFLWSTVLLLHQTIDMFCDHDLINDIYYLDQIQFSNMVFISNCSPDIRHRYSSNGHLWIRWYIFQFSDHCGHPFIRIHSSKLRGVYIPWN